MNMGDTLNMIHKFMQTQNWKLVTAESLTCGLIASTLAEVPGCSAWHRGGYVVYDIDMKVRVLGVDREVAAACNCVSAEVARQMAVGAARLTGCDVIIATTGYAEPWPEGGVEKAHAYVYIKMGPQAWNLHIEAEGATERNDMRTWVMFRALTFLAEQMT